MRRGPSLTTVPNPIAGIARFSGVPLPTHSRRSRLEEADIAVCALWSPTKPHGEYDDEIDFAAVEVSSNLTSVAVETIAGRIFTFRDQRVLLDADLAALYDVPTKQFNQAVKRNSAKFPADFMVLLTPEEWTALRSQVVTSNGDVRVNFNAFASRLASNRPRLRARGSYPSPARRDDRRPRSLSNRLPQPNAQ